MYLHFYVICNGNPSQVDGMHLTLGFADFQSHWNFENRKCQSLDDIA